MTDEKPVIDFSTEVAPDSTVSIEHRFDTDGYVTHLHARAYPGEETAVQRTFQLWKGGKNNGNPIPLVRSPDGANDALIGDDQTWDFDMRRRFEADDVLEVKYRNTGNYDYPVSTVMAVDHDSGMIDRLAGLTGDLL